MLRQILLNQIHLPNLQQPDAEASRPAAEKGFYSEAAELGGENKSHICPRSKGSGVSVNEESMRWEGQGKVGMEAGTGAG